ncbi:MAG: hypothetical protein WAX79_01725 [Candidatus Omnitrophota bacterium]
MSEIVATSPSKLRDLHPAKLSPPPEIIKRIVEQDKTRLPKNPIIRFFKIFMEEGF